MKLRLLSLLFACFSMVAHGLNWEELSDKEQEILERHKNQWGAFSEQRQQGFQLAARKWLSMSEQEREQARTLFEKWRALPPTRKESLRHQFRILKSMKAELQSGLREKREWFSQLPEEEREALVKEWQNTSLEDRRRFREVLNKKFGE